MLVAAFYWLVTYFTRGVLLAIYAEVRAIGVENVPLRGPVIIVANHLNDADPGIMSTRLPRRLVFMTKAELFRVPGLAQFLRLYGAFPVRRNEGDLSALRRSNETLRKGLALVLFPEGTRSGVRASLSQARPGAALIALRNSVPIVPLAITGSQDLGMPGMFLRVFRRRHVTLTFGTAFSLDRPARTNAEAAQMGIEVIMAKIAALLPPEYRGYYGDGPPGVSESSRPEEARG